VPAVIGVYLENLEISMNAVKAGYLSMWLEKGNLLVVRFPRNGPYIESISLFSGSRRITDWRNSCSYGEDEYMGLSLWEALHGDEKDVAMEREVVFAFVQLPPGQKFWIRVNYGGYPESDWDFSATISEFSFYCLAFCTQYLSLKLKCSVDIRFYDQDYWESSDRKKLSCIPPCLRKPL